MIEWTPDRIALLRRLWPDRSVTASEIGERMGISKSAVTGKAHRLELVGRESPIKRRAGSPPKLRGGRPPKPTAPARPPVPDSPHEHAAYQRQRRLEHFEAKGTGNRSCKWPLWPHDARPTHEYCGEKAVNGHPYCVPHCADAFTLVRKTPTESPRLPPDLVGAPGFKARGEAA